MAATVLTPILPEAEIRQEVVRIESRQHRSHLIALLGRGSAGAFEVSGRQFKIVPTRCELELRAALPDQELPEDQGIVYLIDWSAGPLPLDIACRLARGRMGRIAQDTRFAAAFGARQCEPALLRTRLAELVLAGEITDIGKTTGQVLRPQEAYRRAMAAVLALPADDELTLPRVTKWALTNEGGPSFVARGTASQAWAGFCTEVRQRVKEDAGELAEIAWLTWEQGRGRRFVEVLLVLDGLRSQLGTGSYAEGLLRGRLDGIAPGFGQQLLGSFLGHLEPEALDTTMASLPKDGPLQPEALCRSAELLVDDPGFQPALSTSRWLPAGLRAARASLGAALATVADTPTGANAKAAEQAWQRAISHHLAAVASRDIKQAAKDAVRLAYYLVTRRQSGDTTSAGVEAVAALAARYSEEGGWVDLARQHVRSHREQELEPGLTKLLGAVDALVRDDDRRFAQEVVGWLAAGRPASTVIPIEHAVRRLAADVLQEDPGRKLLIVLMDGMSWANAVELVPSLAGEVGHWQPLLWRPKGFRAARKGAWPPVLAAVPTVTSLSRAAFFAGRLANSFLGEQTSKDRDRWASNRTLAGLTETDQPVLLLRDQVLTEGSQLHEAAVRQIAEGPRVVAMVVNAIDEHLAGSTQIAAHFEVTDIKPLREIFLQALAADRMVLLASDHGHVPGDLLVDRRQPVEGGHRWRPLTPGDEVSAGEIALPAPATPVPDGATGIAAAWDERVCYGQPSLGEHGGLTRAEVVAPALLLAPEGLAAALGDEGLKTARLEEPAWWGMALPDDLRPAVRGDGMLPFEPEPEPVAVLRPRLPDLVESLAASPIFKAHVKAIPVDRVREDLERLALLVVAGGSLPEAELARRCGVQTYRIAGLVARMAELCNLEGYAVLAHDIEGKQVVLDQIQLRQLFGIGQ